MISASNSKNWLDRLRSSRGFPTGNEPDLDRFLSSSSSSGSAPTPNGSTTHSESTQSHPPVLTRSGHPPPPRQPPQGGGGGGGGEFNGVLCDLFNMGGETSRSFYLKTSRKQSNPRFCKLGSNIELSSVDNIEQQQPSIVPLKWDSNNVDCNRQQQSSIIPLKRDTGKIYITQSYSRELVSSGDNKQQQPSIVPVKRGTGKVDNTQSYPCNREIVSGGDNNDRVDEELRGGGGGCGDEKDELKGYTRSEATIIDTSFEKWKCDKWVFRKNDEWKIKDKRGKSRGSACGTGKKKKVLVSKVGDGNNSTLNDSNGNDNDQLKLKMMKKKNKRKRELENLLMHQTNKEQPQNEGDPCKERKDFLSKLPKKRFPCPRPPEKVRIESSPVVLLKSIPPSNVNTAIKPGKPFHKKRPKQMKIV